VDLDYSLIRNWRYRWGIRPGVMPRRRDWGRIEKILLLSAGVAIGLFFWAVFELMGGPRTIAVWMK
jgi:hypothetical protein